MEKGSCTSEPLVTMTINRQAAAAPRWVRYFHRLCPLQQKTIGKAKLMPVAVLPDSEWRELNPFRRVICGRSPFAWFGVPVCYGLVMKNWHRTCLKIRQAGMRKGCKK